MSLTGFGEFILEFASSRFPGPFSNTGIGSLTGVSCRIRLGVRVFSLSRAVFQHGHRFVDWCLLQDSSNSSWSSRHLAFSGRAVFQLRHRFVDGCLLEFASSRFSLEGPFSNSGIGSLTGVSCRIRRIHPRVFSLSLEGPFSNSGIGSLTGVSCRIRRIRLGGRVFSLSLGGPFSSSGIGSLTGVSYRIRRIHLGVRVFSLSRAVFQHGHRFVDGCLLQDSANSSRSSRLLAFSGRAVFQLGHRFVDGCLLQDSANSSWRSRHLAFSGRAVFQLGHRFVDGCLLQDSAN